MSEQNVVLQGKHIRLEPLTLHHIRGLVEAAAADPKLYRFSAVPQGHDDVSHYVRRALAWQKAGTALPFAIIRLDDHSIIGSTRFFDIERWAWPSGHKHHRRGIPDVAEIGYTWLTKSAIRTYANTEAKFLLLRYAFEHWKLHRVVLHTDVRNKRSRAAIERIGGHFEGVLRAHRMASDFIPRDSARYSILLSEWPQVKSRLQKMLKR